MKIKTVASVAIEMIKVLEINQKCTDLIPAFTVTPPAMLWGLDLSAFT
jgi:hypothetical protein